MLTSSRKCFLILILLPSYIACTKGVLAPAPATSLNSENVYTNNTSTADVLTGIYTTIMNPNSVQGDPLVQSTYYCSLSADELTLWSGITDPKNIGYYTNTLESAQDGTDFWFTIYPLIYVTNAAINGITTYSSALDPQVVKQGLGEAYFMRAFCYFYLVNLYGAVPLVTTINYKTNESIPRTSTDSVWNQIVSDLKIASSLLSTQFLDATLENTVSQRLRPTKWAACALLAKAYLYTGQWTNCITESDTLLNNNPLFALNSYDSVFSINSTEAIWQLQSVTQGWNSPDAQLFIIPNTGLSGSWPVYLSQTLLNSFEPGDLRRTIWVDSVIIGNSTYYYPYKYQNATLDSATTEYETVLRLGDLILIRAEAEANLGEFGQANSDLNAIRSRANLGNLNINSLPAFENAVLHERQVELFTEWGNRWLDLKRTNSLNSTFGPPGNEYQNKVPGGTWNPDWALYPVPLTEILENASLTQNPGY